MGNRSFWKSKPPAGVAIDWGHPLTNGLEFFMIANEGAGVPRDITGKYNLYIQYNGGGSFPSWRFDSQYSPAVQCPNPDVNFFSINPQKIAVPTNGSVTIEAYFLTTDTGTNYHLIFGNRGGNFGLYLKDDGSGMQADYYDDALAPNDHKSAKKLSLGAFHHVVCANANDATLSMYIDGQLDTVFTSTGTVNTTTCFFEDMFSHNGGEPMAANDAIGFLRIWTRTLTDVECRSLYSQPWAMMKDPIWLSFVPQAAGKAPPPRRRQNQYWNRRKVA